MERRDNASLQSVCSTYCSILRLSLTSYPQEFVSVAPVGPVCGSQTSSVRGENGSIVCRRVQQANGARSHSVYNPDAAGSSCSLLIAFNFHIQSTKEGSTHFYYIKPSPIATNTHSTFNEHNQSTVHNTTMELFILNSIFALLGLVSLTSAVPVIPMEALDLAAMYCTYCPIHAQPIRLLYYC